MTRHSFLEELFPPRYDFFKLLTQQADLTARGVAAFGTWLVEPQRTKYDDFLSQVDGADAIRMKLEAQLIDAFTTPFDREDIYTFSVRMHRVPEFAKLALLAIQSYSVKADNVLIAMTDNLITGMSELARGTAMLEADPKEAGKKIENMRVAHHAVQSIYRESLAALLKGGDPMETIKLREVYHEVREASNAFNLVVDVFHRIIVRLV
jgi:hypothetical protein